VDRLFGFSESIEGAPVQFPQSLIYRIEDKTVPIGYQATSRPAKNLDITGVLINH
jgi:hypothetical protein